MKPLRILFLIVLPILLDLFTGCCDCDTLRTGDSFYTNCNVQLLVINNAGYEPVTTQNHVLDKNAFGLKVLIDRNENTCSLRNKPMFINSAMAFTCKCDGYMFDPIDKVDSLVIYTVSDFDESHSAGSDVTGLFSSYDKSRHDYQSVEKLLKGRLNWSKSVYTEMDEELILLLMTPPTVIHDNQFRLWVKLSDGREFEETTHTVLLQ